MFTEEPHPIGAYAWPQITGPAVARLVQIISTCDQGSSLVK